MGKKTSLQARAFCFGKHAAEAQHHAAFPFLDHVHGIEEPDQKDQYADGKNDRHEIHYCLPSSVSCESAGCGAWTGSTSSVRPFTFLTRTRAPLGILTPAGAAARHNSPWTKTIPAAFPSPTVSVTSASSPTSSSLPVVCFQCARAKHETHQDNDDHGERQRDTQSGAEAHAHSSERRTNQHERAEYHGNHSADSEHTVRRKFRFQNKEYECKDDQQQAREIYRQHVHREKRQDERDAADHARREHSGMRKLNVEAENTDDQQNEEHVGLDDSREEFFACGHFVRGDNRLRESAS